MDWLPKETRSRIMSSIRSTHTKPELVLRKALWAEGLRYRLHYGREKIDIAFPGKKVAVFVDGCFWHGCPRHFRAPASNKGYWRPKIERNKIRAKEKDRRLRGQGWKIVHIWEHELKKKPEKAAKKVYNKFMA